MYIRFDAARGDRSSATVPGIVKVSCVPCVSRLPPVLKFKFKLLHKQQTTVLFVAMTL
jgi:hypothetical protein